MYNTGCLIFAHSILSTPVTSAVVRAPLRMMARWQSRAGMSLEFTPPLLHSQSVAARDFQCDYHFFFFSIPPRPPLVNAVSCYYYSDSVVANKNCFNFTIISFGMHIFLGSHPISAITNECPISPSHEVLCETRPWCGAAGDDQSRSLDDVLWLELF